MGDVLILLLGQFVGFILGALFMSKQNSPTHREKENKTVPRG